ncbi:MAG: hypothetical protein ACFCUL_14370 [Flavobacteriaceae bacterium]
MDIIVLETSENYLRLGSLDFLFNKTIVPYQIILLIQQITHRIVQLPGDLDTPWPIVGIGYGGVPAFGESGSFGVEVGVYGIVA